MKCKVGDLAFVVKAELPSNHGVLVEVMRSAGRTRWWVRSLCGARMATDGTRRVEVVALDASLRPIRDSKRGHRRRYVAAPSMQGNLI